MKKFQAIVAGDTTSDRGIFDIGWHSNVDDAVQAIRKFCQDNRLDIFWAVVKDKNGDVVWNDDPIESGVYK